MLAPRDGDVEIRSGVDPKKSSRDAEKRVATALATVD
jgi:hypothetical protein